MKTLKTAIQAFVAGMLVTLAAAAAYGLGGGFDVAATTQDSPLLRWFLHRSFQSSVARRADGIAVPDGLDAPERIARGARSFAAMCAGCHTPPGLTDTPRAVGLNPRPPKLSEMAADLDAAQTFWVIRHGVRMTGMPAFGPTHDDDTLWDLTAFVRAGRTIDAASYRRLSAGPLDDGHDHRHGDAPEPAGGHDHDGGHGDGHDHNGSHGDGHAHDHGAGHEQGEAPQAGTPEAAVDAFHAALRAADENAVLALLAPDVRIFESGRVEASRDAYRSHHLPADIAAAQSVRHRLLERDVLQVGTIAAVMSRTHVTGTHGGKPVDMSGTETMVLTDGPNGWHIAHIHWSFGPPPKPATDHEDHDHAH